MDLVLVRHGRTDKKGKLTARGHHEVGQLKLALQRRNVVPSLYVCSDRSQARQTAGVLCGDLAGTPTLCGELTPLKKHQLPCPERRAPVGSLEAILDELQDRHTDLAAHETIALIGHEGRLSNLLTELTAARHRPFNYAEAVVVHGGTPTDLLTGHGTISFRYPVLAHDEERLRNKAQSKMTVSTFLAGFVFTALIAVMLTEQQLPLAHVLATVALTFALALFVACVYLYDQLSMPEGFWTDGPRRGPYLWLAERKEEWGDRKWTRATAKHRNERAADDAQADIVLDGRLFTTMVRTSRWVFTPGVWCALVGFAALLAELERPWIQVAGGVAALTGLVLFFFFRADTGLD